ncbi:hypothetical protein [Streptomyces peucetius]|uniref:Condensation domain-containing protein n=1 Tax=Streptomyces peucetius TaxID=1950 RepID=A0ABY6I712_STRPE|nr:hypothetical protein [Streptomyces peucetius]UYQ62631.1 hypothetical protein OGH68_14830 [Streptomyces peucetius]
MTAVRDVRRLGDIEATFAYQHALMHGDTQATTGFTVNAEFCPEYVAQAVALWVRRFPLLSLRIGEVRGSLWFQQGPGPGPGQLIQGGPAGHGSPADRLADEVNDVLPAGGGLWRLRVVHGRDPAATRFYFTVHPALSDAHSTGRLVRGLLDLLFKEAAVDGVRPAVEGLPPAADELTYVAPPPVPFDPRAAGGRPGEARQPPRRRPPWSERRAGVVSLSLPPRESLRLNRWCAERRITPGQFLAAALARIHARRTGQEEVVLSNTVSLRGRYAERVMMPDAGCCLHEVAAALRIGGGPTADHARAYAASLRAADAAWRPARREHARIRRAVEAEAAGGTGPDIRVTDAGSVDVALGVHAARVADFRTAVNRKATPAVGALHVSVLRGALALSLTYGVPDGDSATAETAARELRNEALRTARSG